METQNGTNSDTDSKINLIRKLFCDAEPDIVLTPEQNSFLTERAAIENNLWEILERDDPDELKLIEEYGLTWMAGVVRREMGELRSGNLPRYPQVVCSVND